MTSIMGRLATYSGARITWDECINSKVALADFDSLESFNSPAPVQPIAPGQYAILFPVRTRRTSSNNLDEANIVELQGGTQAPAWVPRKNWLACIFVRRVPLACQ